MQGQLSSPHHLVLVDDLSGKTSKQIAKKNNTTEASIRSIKMREDYSRVRAEMQEEIRNEVISQIASVVPNAIKVLKDIINKKKDVKDSDKINAAKEILNRAGAGTTDGSDKKVIHLTLFKPKWAKGKGGLGEESDAIEVAIQV